nr:hypothetical protein [Tanacetum cinerariifolium]
MAKNGLVTTWARFEESVRNCFGPSEYEDLNETLSKLLQLGTVKDYQHEFEKLMNRATDIPDSLLISFYIFGLKLHLQREFLVSRPTTLGDAFSLSLITETRLDDQAALVAGMTTKTFGNNGGDDSESSGPVTPTKNEKAIESGDTSILNSCSGTEQGVVKRMHLPIIESTLLDQGEVLEGLQHEQGLLLFRGHEGLKKKTIDEIQRRK